MTRDFRLTKRAEASLYTIARWTHDRFGPRQMDIYRTELIEKCKAIAAGRSTTQSCSALFPGIADDLRFARAGEHFVVFLEQPTQIIVVDILHSRSELPRHLASLSAKEESGET